MDHDFNVFRLVKKLRHFEVILQSSILKSEERKFQVAHTYQNVIDLDDSDLSTLFSPEKTGKKNAAKRNSFGQ